MGSVSTTELTRRLSEYGVPADYGRERCLRRVREPGNLLAIGTDIHAREQRLVPRAARALARMREAAANDGISLEIVSAFRSIGYQCGIFERKLARGQSIEEILAVSAAPGYSEHHSGRALDLTTPGFTALEVEFEHSPAFTWLQQHADRYRFKLSYPRGNRNGIDYEPWHWCWHQAKS